MKRSKPIPRTTSRRARERSRYSRRVGIYKRRYPWCVACLTVWPNPWIGSSVIRCTDDVHHKMGCEGQLLLDERWWMPVCRLCHDWIEDHGRAARELGFVLDKDYR